MLFRQLEYLVALSRERHFARAAQACRVSQPALSEAVRKLEDELGVPLVRRGRTYEGLTPRASASWCGRSGSSPTGTLSRPRSAHCAAG